jgi:hypothetical protein
LTAKEKHRPKLKNWQRDGFGSTRENEFLALGALSSGVTEISTPAAVATATAVDDNCICRIGCSSMSYLDFIRHFERPAIPCVIADIPAVERWDAVGKWDRWEYFRSMKNSYFKVGEDDDGYSVKVGLGAECVESVWMQ